MYKTFECRLVKQNKLVLAARFKDDEYDEKGVAGGNEFVKLYTYTKGAKNFDKI